MISKKRRKELEQLETKDSKYCTKCKIVKPLSEFNVNSCGYKSTDTYCIECAKKRSKENHLLRSYGITLKDYDKLLEKQGGRCKICGTETPGGMGRFHVDHNHQTGEIRGLLCYHCNTLLSNAKDDIKILTSAIQYLINSRK